MNPFLWSFVYFIGFLCLCMGIVLFLAKWSRAEEREVDEERDAMLAEVQRIRSLPTREPVRR